VQPEYPHCYLGYSSESHFQGLWLVITLHFDVINERRDSSVT